MCPFCRNLGGGGDALISECERVNFISRGVVSIVCQ